MARDSWYIRTTAVKDRLLAHSAAAAWHPPEIGSGRMGEWLANNVDSAISRDRFWGTPLPIWVCDADTEHRTVVGSFELLAELVGPLPADFDPHRPGIDELTWSCGHRGVRGDAPGSRGAGHLVRLRLHAVCSVALSIREQGAIRSAFPADSHRGRSGPDAGLVLYSLLAISTLLFDEGAYRAVVVNDLVLDEDGRRCRSPGATSSIHGRPCPIAGADAIRFYLLASSNPWLPKRWDSDGSGRPTGSCSIRCAVCIASLPCMPGSKAGRTASRAPARRGSDFRSTAGSSVVWTR